MDDGTRAKREEMVRRIWLAESKAVYASHWQVRGLTGTTTYEVCSVSLASVVRDTDTVVPANNFGGKP